MGSVTQHSLACIAAGRSKAARGPAAGAQVLEGGALHLTYPGAGAQVLEDGDSVPARWQRAHPGEQRVFTNATLPGVRHSGVPVRQCSAPRPAPGLTLACATSAAMRCVRAPLWAPTRSMPSARSPAMAVSACLRRAGALATSARPPVGELCGARMRAGRAGLTRAGGARRGRAGAGQPLRLRPVRADLLRLLHGRAAAGRPGAQGRQGQARRAGRRGDRGRATPNPCRPSQGPRGFQQRWQAAAGSSERGLLAFWWRPGWWHPSCGLAGRGLCAGSRRCA